jgi:hypothetical protein
MGNTAISIERHSQYRAGPTQPGDRAIRSLPTRTSMTNAPRTRSLAPSRIAGSNLRRSPLRAKTAVITIASLGILGTTLVGCSAAAAPARSSNTTVSTGATPSSSASKSAASSSPSSSASKPAISSSPSSSASKPAISSSPSSGPSKPATSSYNDGSYSQQGIYASPGGQEVISVALTLKSDIVTAVTVTTVTADPTATAYEAMFESGIGAVVVGKNITTLNVSHVAGSSLTSLGFNDALTKIKGVAKS